MDRSADVCDITFVKKVRIFSNDYLKCCLYISDMQDPKNEFTKKLYSKLISSSLLLEDFLDFHGLRITKNGTITGNCQPPSGI